MNSVNLNPLDAALYSSERFQRAGWLIPLFLRFVCLGRQDVMDLTGISKDTAGKYLDDLARLGIVVRQGYRDGYVLTVGGKQLVATLLLAAPQPVQADEVIEEQPADEPESERLNSPFEAAEAPDQVSVDEIPSTKSERLNSPFPKNLDLKIKEEDSINLIKSSSLDSSERLNSPFDKTRYLAAIANLFDASIGSEIHPEISEADILAWTAKGWKERGNFREQNGAVGMIYNKISKGIAAPSKWRTTYHLHLPESFLEECGLISFTCKPCALKFKDREEFDAHHCPAQEVDQQAAPVAAESATTETDQSVTDQIAELWQIVLEHLQQQLQRAQFDTWVIDTHVIAVQGRTLKVGVHNAYACDWLTEYMTEPVNQVLEQLADVQGMRVSFVTACSESDD